MIKCAILGFGTVGVGVAELLDRQKEKLSAAAGDELDLAYILVRRDMPDSPWRDKLTQDFSVIENDPDVAVVAEVIGGVGAAYDYTRREKFLAHTSILTFAAIVASSILLALLGFISIVIVHKLDRKSVV